MTANEREHRESVVPKAARALWRDLAGDPAAFAPGTTTVVAGSRGICPPGWTGAVRLGDAVLIDRGRLTDASLALLRELDDPTDPEQVREALAPAETRGPGELAYLPAGVGPTAPPGTHDLGTLPVDGLQSWLSALPQEDVDESGIGDMDEVIVLRRDGQIVGAAGHHDWPADVAHLGVVVDPRFRGSGAGAVLGGAATRRALALGRHPQWRAASWNATSRAVARRIGYVEVGRQFSFTLDR